MYKYLLTIVIAAFFGVTGVYGQSSGEDEFNSPRQIGLTFSTLGGSGIYYQFPATEKDNIKFTGLFIYSNEESFQESFFSLGVEYQRDLHEAETRRGYLIFGTHIDNQISEDLYFDYSEDRSSYFNLGTGIGFDFGDSHKGILLSAHITYQLTTGLYGSDRTRIGLGGGFGIGFNF